MLLPNFVICIVTICHELVLYFQSTGVDRSLSPFLRTITMEMSLKATFIQRNSRAHSITPGAA